MLENLEVRQYTVLLLDDSASDRGIYHRYLTKNHPDIYQIFEFSNGEDALRWCQQQMPDVMLVDYFLPGMDGLAFLQSLRQQTGKERIPAIMMTGQGNTKVAVDLFKSGAQDYLDKNLINAENLHQAISNVLRQTQRLQQQERQQQRQQLITRTALSIRKSLNIEDILYTTVTEVRAILESDRAIIYQFQPDGTGLVVQESAADQAFSIIGWVILEECFPEMWIEPYRQGRTRTIDDVNTDPSLTECHREFLTSLMVRANLIIPIIQGEILWGLLIAHQCTAPRHWTSLDVEFMSQLAIQVSIAIQQASLIEKLQTELAERKLTEIALQEREQQLELFAKYAPAGIAMFDQNMRYVIASQRWINDYQLESLEAIIGKSHYEIFPEVTEKWRQIHQHCLAGAVEKCEEDLFVRVDGLHQWLRWEIHPWYNSTQDIAGIIIFSEDISNRKQVEMELQQLNMQLEKRVSERTSQLAQSNNHLQRELLQREKLERELRNREKLLDGFFNAASQANVGLSIVNTDLRFLKINQALATVNGYSIEEHLGKLSLELLPDIAQTISPLLQTVLDTKQPISNLEISGFVPSQPEVIRYWLVSYFPIWGETQNPVALGTILIEITERKHLEIEREKLITILEATEATLKESDRRWKSLLDNVQLVVIGLDVNGNVEYVNPFFLQLTDYTQAEVLGKNWVKNFLPESQHHRVKNTFHEVMKNNFYAHYHNAILTKLSEERMISWSDTLLRDLEGNPIGTISIGEDITERYKLERIKAEFISVVSHELRTPLTSMQAGLSLLHEKIIDANSPDGEATIEIATQGVDRLVRLVNDILDLERLESGKIRLEKSICNTAELINTAISQMQEMASQGGIILNPIPSSYQIYADPDRLVQVLINLLSNAIKFSPIGSTVWLTVESLISCQSSFVSKQKARHKKQETGESKIFSPSPYLLFTVKDQGRGIPSYNLESIFERFHQVDASDSRTKGGTGLGLAISRSIVEQHGGTIWAESVLGEGSTFYFTLLNGESN